MKHLIYSIVIYIISITNLWAQNYIPINFEDGIWRENYYQATGVGGINYTEDYQYFTAGDTIIDGLVHYEIIQTGRKCYTGDCETGAMTPMYEYFSEEKGLIHEENKKVYYNDVLIYDFNVGLGDDISSWEGILGNVTIEAVDSIEMCGIMRRRLRASTFAISPVHFIEGVGSSAGLIPRYEYFEMGANLSCYSDTNCAPCELISTANENIISSDLLLISPNPVNDILEINAKDLILSQVELINIQGQSLLIKEKELSFIDMSGLSKGIYFIRCFSENKVGIKRIVKN